MRFRIPASCRACFRIDAASGTLLSLGQSILGLAVPILRKSLLAPAWLVTLLISVQNGYLVLSPAWAGASHERRKVPFVVVGAWVAGLLMIVMAFSAPLVRAVLAGRAPGWTVFGATLDVLAFFLLACAVYVASSGLTALLTSVYRSNYPVMVRAQIISRANVFKFAAALLVTWGLSYVLDIRPDAYVALFVLGGLVFLAGGTVYRRMPVAGEDSLPTGLNPTELRRHLLPHGVLSTMRNRHFLRFQLCQTLHGAANLVCGPAFLLVMTDEMKLDYFNIVMLGTVIPSFCQILSSVSWAPMIDRLSPSKARAVTAPLWAAGFLLFPLASAGNLWPAYVSRAIVGLAWGAASLLWTLGPLYYAPKSEAALYLGTHNFLTGLRGVIFSILGGLIYVHSGRWVFVVGAGMMLASGALFYLQDRAERRDGEFRSESDGGE